MRKTGWSFLEKCSLGPDESGYRTLTIPGPDFVR
jgi:hypothetical protein